MGRRGSKRTDKVGQQVWELLASFLLFDVSDPRLKKVQITGVDVTPDLKFADVHFIMIDQDDPVPPDGVRTALGGSAGFLRKMLGDQLTMRYTPELRFHYDKSIQQGRRIEELLDTVRPDEEE